MIPPKLKDGDQIRVIAPSESVPDKLTPELIERGIKRLESLGLEVSFGKYVYEKDGFDTASPQQRLDDLHDAFSDPNVKAILAMIGGSSANQLLKHIDYDLIKKNPKIFCGLSDLTEISSALYVKSGLVTYYGPHFTMLASSKLIDYSLESMKATFFYEEPVNLTPSSHFLNSSWDEEVIVNSSFWAINTGEAEAESIGGNLMTLNFLLGNQYFPNIRNCILYIEENHLIDHKGVQKEIQEIINHPDGDKIAGIIIGRFQTQTGMSRELVTRMIRSKKEFNHIPVVANVDISHTAPMASIPFGGRIKLKVDDDQNIDIQVIRH